jgi:hypothetical protein
MTKKNAWSLVTVLAAMASGARAENVEDYAQPSLPTENFVPPQRNAIQRLTTAQIDVDAWAPVAGQAAHRLMEKYGAPDEIRPAYLAWDDVGPWTRTIVFDVDVSSAGGKDSSLIQQSVNYALGPEQVAALAAFDVRLKYDKRSGLLSALSETEELNFLRLNLADDVITGRKTPNEARADFDRTVSLSESGKTSGSMHGLHFPFGVLSD